VRQVSSGYNNFVTSSVHLTPCRLQHVPCRLLQMRYSWKTSITDRLQRALNAAARVISDTATVVCRDSCIPSFIGWTSLNELSINSVCLCTDASSTKLLGTSWITAHQSLTLFSAIVYVLPSLHPVLSVQYLQPSSFVCCWPDCLELSVQRHA